MHEEARNLLQLLERAGVSLVHAVGDPVSCQRGSTEMDWELSRFASQIGVQSIKIQNTTWSDELAGNVLGSLI